MAIYKVWQVVYEFPDGESGEFKFTTQEVAEKEAEELAQDGAVVMMDDISVESLDDVWEG